MSVRECDVFRKPGTARAIQWERAGLEWLEEAATSGGARVVGIVGSDASQLCLERISHVAPSCSSSGGCERDLRSEKTPGIEVGNDTHPDPEVFHDTP